jgi:hypothetical protein
VQVEILFAAIPKVRQDLAYGLAQRSFELIRDASPSMETRRQSLKRLLSLAHSQRLLADKRFCEELTLALAEVAEFQDARRALAANGALYQDVALKTSGKTPGFALDALNRALESNRDLTYSEQHAQILANITQQIAKYSPEVAKRVWDQSIKMARQLVPVSAVKHQERLDFYRRSYSPPNPRITDPAHIRFGEGGSQPIAVRIVLEADFQTFVETREQLFIESLADMLRVSPGDVLILDRSEGSIGYILYFVLQAVSYILKRKFETQDEDIQRLQIVIDAPIILVELVIPTRAQVAEAAARKPAVPEGKVVEIELEERIPKEMVRVRIRLPDGAKDTGDVNLPFDEEELTTVLKILEKRSLDDSRIWRPSQIETLYRLGLIDKPGIVPDVFPRVMTHFGQVLTRRKPGRFSQILEGHRWLTILMALAFRLGLKRESWEPYQIGILYEMGLINRINLIPTHLQEVGNMIYDQDGKGLASNRKIYHLLQSSIEQSIDENVAWQLEINKANTHLTRYPWELASKEDRHLLLDSSLKLDLARSILPCGAARPLEVSLPLNVLYIESRPDDSGKLPGDERRMVEDALQDLKKTGLVDLTVLSSSRDDPTQSPPTFVHVLDHLPEVKTKDFHVIHFDGHGQFGRKCPKCGRPYYPHYQTCVEGCQANLGPPQGFLQFENSYKLPDWVNCDDLFYLLDKPSVRLMVLSACFSGTV